MCESVLRIAGMVSQTSFALVGLALLVGFLILRRSDNLTDIPGPSKIPIQENQEIKGLKSIISEVEGFIKTNFKAPILPKGLSGGKCRGPNCLGIFQAKGTRSAFDPISGQRLAIAGSPKFQEITGSNFALNQARIQQGVALKSDFTNFLTGLQTQLNILQTKSV